MAYISDFGIACCVPMAALATLTTSGAIAAPENSLSTIAVKITGLHNNRGAVKLVLCPAGKGFPDCGAAGVTGQALITDHVANIRLENIVPAQYAVAIFHDENNNGRLDTFIGIPKEGFGFSGNPPVRPRAPTFAECKIDIDGHRTFAIKMNYLF